MTLWRLEVLRLVRTHRWMILFGVYAFFGVLGPVTARYFNEIMERFAGEVTIVAPDPRPADGIIQFISNASQLGVLALVVVAAAALSLDTKPELAAFLRSKVTRPGRLLLPPYTTTVVAAALALAIGTLVAATMTTALIGPLPFWPIVAGTLFGVAYLGFAVAVVAWVAGFTRSQATTVFGALAILVVLPIVSIVDRVEPWLPSTLVGAVAAMVEGDAASEFGPALMVTLVAAVTLTILAMRRLERREL
jgi:ABC-2 type transport system permease protein